MRARTTLASTLVVSLFASIVGLATPGRAEGGVGIGTFVGLVAGQTARLTVLKVDGSPCEGIMRFFGVGIGGADSPLADKRVMIINGSARTDSLDLPYATAAGGRSGRASIYATFEFTRGSTKFCKAWFEVIDDASGETKLLAPVM